MSFDISKAIEAKSDQLNAIDYAAGPGIVTITEARPGDADQQVWLKVAEHPGKYFKPSKTALRVIAKGWGTDASQYVGKRLELYNDPDVMWAGQKVGGIRVSAMSHIEKPFKMRLPVSRGKTQEVTVKQLPDAPQAAQQQVDEAPDYEALIQQANGDQEKLRQLWSWASANYATEEVLNKIQAAAQPPAQGEQQ